MCRAFRTCTEESSWNATPYSLLMFWLSPPMTWTGGSGIRLPAGAMAVAAISAASLGQYVLGSSDSTQLRRACRTCRIVSTQVTATARSQRFRLCSNSAKALRLAVEPVRRPPLNSTDLTALRSPLSSGDLATAQSAFATPRAASRTLARRHGRSRPASLLNQSNWSAGCSIR